MLKDDDEEKEVNINELYRSEVETQIKRVTSKHCGIDFTVDHVRLCAGEYSQHTIHLCANGRDVQHVTLSQFVPYIPSKFKSPNGRLFVYKAYVSSPFLDQRVNAERTAFDLAREGDMQSQSEPTEKALIESIVQAACIELGSLLSQVEEKIKQRIETLVGTKYPEYRPILKEVDTYLREFRENAEEREILTKLMIFNSVRIFKHETRPGSFLQSKTQMLSILRNTKSYTRPFSLRRTKLLKAAWPNALFIEK